MAIREEVRPGLGMAGRPLEADRPSGGLGKPTAPVFEGVLGRPAMATFHDADLRGEGSNLVLLPPAKVFSSGRQWSVPDGAAAFGLVALCVSQTLSLAQGDKELKQRFATEQLAKEAGLQINQQIAQLLVQGCTIFDADNYLHTIDAFEQFQDKSLIFFFSTLPLTADLVDDVNRASGCAGFFYPPERTHPSILSFISTTAKARNFTKVIESRGMELLVSDPTLPVVR
jgi:hypothetical protein